MNILIVLFFYLQMHTMEINFVKFFRLFGSILFLFLGIAFCLVSFCCFLLFVLFSIRWVYSVSPSYILWSFHNSK
jgi:hypothetical protein